MQRSSDSIRIGGRIGIVLRAKVVRASVMTAGARYLGTRQNLSDRAMNRESPFSVFRAYGRHCYVLEGVNDRILDHHAIPAVVGDGVIEQLRR